MKSPLPVLLPLIAILAAGCGVSESREAPAFSLKSTDGSVVSLSAQKGRVVLVNFWATWCVSCVDELPALRQLRNSHGQDSFALLAVSIDENAKAVPSFVAAHEMPFPVLLADGKIAADYAVRALPTSYLIAPDGSIARRYLGPLDVRAVENDILSLLNKNRRPS